MLPKSITKQEANVILEYAWKDVVIQQILDAWFDAIER